jgi:hypothetical protein
LALLEAIEYEFDAAGNPQFFEDSEQIISDDLLLARGYTARQVALVCYALTAALVIVGWFVLRLGTKEALVVSALVACALFGMEVRMGALRSQDSSRKNLAEEDLRWRQMADQGLRGKA